VRFLVALLTVAFVLSAVGQVRESVTVEVVQVPVYVTTGDGKPVLGLTKDAFQLFVDGRQQAIDYFDIVDFASAPPGTPAVQRPLRERRLYLLLFDLAFATPASIDRAQRAARLAVMHSNPVTDLFAVATYSSVHGPGILQPWFRLPRDRRMGTQHRGVFFISPFTTDRAAIARSIGTLDSSAANDPLGLAIASAERAHWMATMEQGGAASGSDADISDMLKSSGRVGGGGDVDEILKGGTANAANQRAPAAYEVEDQMEGLGELAVRFSQLEGQKHVLLLTEGFDTSHVTGIASSTGTSSQSGPLGLDAHLVNVLQRMHQIFVSSGVMLDSIDIKGVRHTFDDLENDALYMLSNDTGGRTVVNHNNLVEAVDTLMRAEQVVYVLGFRQGDRNRGKISVKVSGLPHGSEVKFREGFGYVTAPSDVGSLQLADILANDVPQSGVTLDGVVHPSATGAELTARFARAEVVPQLVDKAPSADVFLYVFDTSGSAVGFKSKRIDFIGADRVTNGNVALHGSFDLPPGHYTAKFLLQITGTRLMGFARRDFTVE
jgi:VWFA-related protein